MNLKGDLFGGITASIIALPLALAFGVASGAGAVAGLYGAIMLGFFASFFGGTPTQISGPTGPMTVVFASVVLTFSNDINAVMCVVLLAGVLQIVFGVLRLGKFVKYIPYPVISGFMSGIGVIIIILQINPFLGVDGNSSIIGTIINLPSTLTHENFKAIILATLTLIIVFLTPKKIANIIPPTLIALILATLVSILLGFDVKSIGDIPTSLPKLIIPTFEISKYSQIISFAITLALLGSIDTLLTSLVADSITKTKHNSNRELIGQGVGNILVSFIGGLPGAGATMRTVINIKSGGVSKYSGMIHSLFLLAIMLFFAPLASKIPLAVLAGILIKVGIDILDYKFLSIMKNAPRNDLIIMLVVFFMTVFVDLIMAVGVGITLASLLIVYRISKEAQINLVSPKTENTDIVNEQIMILNIDGAFFFGSASFFIDSVNSVLDKKELIIDCTHVPFMDISAIFVLEDIVLKLNAQDIVTTLVLKPRHINKIKHVDKMHVFDDVNIYETLSKAISSSKFTEQ